MSGGGGSSSDGGSGASGSNKAAFTGNAAYSGSTKPSTPPGGGATSLGSGRDFSGGEQNNYEDHDEGSANLQGHVEYAPTHHIENIHGEFDDPDSASHDATYNAREQAIATRESAFGTGKHAGSEKWNPTTQKMERFQDYTFKEHWDRAPDAIKMSPTLRFLYATGKNIGEWANQKGFKLGGSSSHDWTTNQGEGGSGERDAMNKIAPHAPYMVSGITPPSSSPAANWYGNLGKTSTNNSSNIGLQYANAKQAVAKTLSNKGALGMLAVNDSPYYDWLKTKGLDKGIL